MIALIKNPVFTAVFSALCFFSAVAMGSWWLIGIWVAYVMIAFRPLHFLKTLTDQEVIDISRRYNTSIIQSCAFMIDFHYEQFSSDLSKFQMRIKGREPNGLTGAEKYEAKALKDQAIDLRERSAFVLARLLKKHNLTAHGIHVYRQRMNHINSNMGRLTINLDMISILVENLEKP